MSRSAYHSLPEHRAWYSYRVPVTKIQLREEAGWRIVTLARQEIDELRAVGVEVSGEG